MNAEPTVRESAADSVLGVVVVNFGSHKLLSDNLVPAGLTSSTVEVVIVDNFSTETERAVVARLAEQQGWAFIGLASNTGFGSGVNVGLRHAAGLGCSAFLILNPDVHVTRDIVSELHAHLRCEPMALITPRLVTSEGVTVFDGSRVFVDSGRIRRQRPPAGLTGPQTVEPRLEADGREAWAWLPGTCLAIHADLLARVGGFDEAFFLYWEDVDLSVRCADSGGSLVIRHDLAVVHDEGGTQNRRDARMFSSHYYYWNCRNRVLFATRHLSRIRLLRWILLTPRESWQILMRGGRRQLLHSSAPLSASVRGSLAGLALGTKALLGRAAPRGQGELS